MHFYGHKRLASLLVILIIFLTTDQFRTLRMQPNAGWLWGEIAIYLLLGSASIGLTMIRTKKSNKRIERLESIVDNKLAAYIESIVAQKTKVWAEEIFDLRAKLESSAQEKRALDLKLDRLNKKLADLTSQSQSQLPVASDPYTLSMKKAAINDQSLPSLIGHLQLSESIRSEPMLSGQEITMVRDQMVISGEVQSSVISKIDNFTSAIELNNGSVIRDQSDSELNIVKESEDALVRREPGHKTQLEDVNGGGSYYRLSEGDRSWLFPTPLTFKMIVRNQPSKGLFRYEVNSASIPRIKQPAEIKRISINRWEVTELGTIIVPK